MNINVQSVVLVTCQNCGKTTKVNYGQYYVCPCGFINRGQ